MKFPHLFLAIRARGRAHFELAAALRRSPASFSRCVNGREEFLPHERTRLAEQLGCDSDWLFEEVPIPPPSKPATELVGAGA